MIINRIESITKSILDELNIKKAKDIRLTEIAKQLDIKLIEKDMENNMSGLFLLKDDNAYIFYNKKEVKQRQRFTIAHELGHFVLHKSTHISISKSTTVLFRNEKSSSGEYKNEREANSFAASILMPKEFITKEIDDSPDEIKNVLEYLSKIFHVSQLAMSFRLANLGYSFKGAY